MNDKNTVFSEEYCLKTKRAQPQPALSSIEKIISLLLFPAGFPPPAQASAAPLRGVRLVRWCDVRPRSPQPLQPPQLPGRQSQRCVLLRARGQPALMLMPQEQRLAQP